MIPFSLSIFAITDLDFLLLSVSQEFPNRVQSSAVLPRYLQDQVRFILI